MKNLVIFVTVLFVSLFFASCTEQSRAKNFGGDVTYHLPKGQKLINATWKEDQIWYLIRPMKEDEIPETYWFLEKSSLGVWEGTVTFIETK